MESLTASGLVYIGPTSRLDLKHLENSVLFTVHESLAVSQHSCAYACVYMWLIS